MPSLGCEVAVADMGDVAALTAAFSGARGVFVLLRLSSELTKGHHLLYKRLNI
jgi:uncharacterized protein YbjT (DUF2867 family)